MELKDVRVGDSVVVTSHADVSAIVLRKYKNGKVAVETDDDTFFVWPADLELIGGQR